MLGITFGKKKAPAATTDLSYCESVWAGPTSPNHIRVFAEQGLMAGGGANTPALCGSEVSWDLRAITNLAELEQRIANAHETNRVCAKCTELAKDRLSA
jgi:hypothetical protein